jgi:hypothetical protein
MGCWRHPPVVIVISVATGLVMSLLDRGYCDWACLSAAQRSPWIASTASLSHLAHWNWDKSWLRHIFELTVGGGYINQTSGYLLINNWSLSPSIVLYPSTLSSSKFDGDGLQRWQLAQVRQGGGVGDSYKEAEAWQWWQWQRRQRQRSRRSPRRRSHWTNPTPLRRSWCTSDPWLRRRRHLLDKVRACRGLAP